MKWLLMLLFLVTWKEVVPKREEIGNYVICGTEETEMYKEFGGVNAQDRAKNFVDVKINLNEGWNFKIYEMKEITYAKEKE